MPSALILCLSLALAPPAPPQAQRADTPTVITNVTVLPMNTDRVLAGQSVVIERGIITHIAPSGAVTVPGWPAKVLRLEHAEAKAYPMFVTKRQ